MICAAAGIGYAKSPVAGSREPAPEPDLPGGAVSFVWDNADALSDRAVRELDKRNDRLWRNYHVTIGVVTCNYGGDDLLGYGLQCVEDMGLGGYDMIVMLDISGDNYWLIQGNDLRRDFTDADCTEYANEYLEYWFARGNYGDAVLSLTEALEAWYGSYFG